MKVLAHLQGQNTCVDILVDIINERFGVRGFAPSSFDVTLKFRCQFRAASVGSDSSQDPLLFVLTREFLPPKLD